MTNVRRAPGPTGAAAVVTAVCVACAACTGPSFADALAKGDYAAARAAAHDRAGAEKLQMDTWMRSQASLEISRLNAEELSLPVTPAGAAVALPLRVRLAMKLDLKTMRAQGRYEVRVRRDGVLWTNGGGDTRESWTKATVVEPLLGSGATWMPYEETAVLHALYGGDAGVEPRLPRKDVFDGSEVLMPTAVGLGPPAIVVDALVEWPDAASDPEVALHWAVLEFLVPLPDGERLVDRVNAVRTPVVVRPVPHELPQLLDDL